MTARLTPREQAAFDAGFDAASKAFRDGARDCARQSAYALAELAAERARMRRWELRLRWRQSHRGDATEKRIDRLYQRAWNHPAQNLRTGRPDWRHFSLPLTGHVIRILAEARAYPIAGPKPGRFLP